MAQAIPPRTYQELGAEEDPNASILARRHDGSTSISVIPLEPGAAEFTVRALFADGGVARSQFPGTVPNDGSLHLLNALEDDGPSLPTVSASTLHLLLQSPGNSRTLFPSPAPGNSYRAIPLNPKDVVYSVKSSRNTPVILLDPNTGALTVQHLGHALITAPTRALNPKPVTSSSKV